MTRQAVKGGTDPSKKRMTDVGILDKTAAILQLLMSASMTPGEICEAVGLSRSTGYRLLRALASHDFIIRTATGHIVLGPFPRRDVLAEVRTVLTRLRDQTGESVQLWMLNGDQRACVMAVESNHELRISKTAGMAQRLDAGGSGAFALLSAGSPSELFVTRGGRRAGIGSATIAFDVESSRRLALCVSFPLARVSEDAGWALGTPLSDSVQLLLTIVPGSGVSDLLESIAAGSRLDI